MFSSYLFKKIMVLSPAKIPFALQRFVVFCVVYRVFIAKTTKSLEKQQNFRPTGQDNNR